MKGIEGSYLASLALSLSSLPHSQSLPGSTAKCRDKSLCSESVKGMTAVTEREVADLEGKFVKSTLMKQAQQATVGLYNDNVQTHTPWFYRASPALCLAMHFPFQISLTLVPFNSLVFFIWFPGAFPNKSSRHTFK